jgi:tetratricopeptide (TPR) repeat protein
VSNRQSEITGKFAEAKRLYQGRKLDESEAVFSEIAKDKEFYPAGHYGLGVINYARAHYESAEQHLRKCLEGVPGDALFADALHYLGLVSLARFDPAGSLKFHREAVRKCASHYGSIRQVALIERYFLQHAKTLYRRRRLPESKKAFQTLLESRNYRAGGLYGLGVIEFLDGSAAKAAQRFNECLDLHPRHANAWYYLGRIAEHNEHGTTKAQECYRKALAINPSHVGAALKCRNGAGEGKAATPSRAGEDSPLKAHVPKRKHGKRS